MTSFMQASRPNVDWRSSARARAALPNCAARSMTCAQVPANVAIILRSKRLMEPLASSEPTRPPQQRYSANSSSSCVSDSSILSRILWQKSTGHSGISRRKRIQAKSSAQERKIAST